MQTYEIYKPFLMRFASEGHPFVTFDQFNNLVRLYRDDFYASQHVAGFINDIGIEYNVWTVDCHNRYSRHLWFKKIKKPIWISFDVPHLRKRSTIPLLVKIFDDDGLYFEQLQHICLERRVGDRFSICAWDKVATVRDFVLGELRNR